MAKTIAVLGFVMLVAGCGYGFVNERETFGPDVRQIEIQPFENRSREAGFERMMSDSLNEEFDRRGVLQPIYGRSTSDGEGQLVMVGEIQEIEIQSNALSSVALTVEDAIEIQLSVVVHSRESKKPVWRRRGWVVRETFLSSPDPQVYDANKTEALRKMSAQIAGQIHDELFLRH